MYTIGIRRFSRNFLTTLAVSFVAGVGLVSLTLHFGYRNTFWLVCGLPLGFFIILWGLQSAPAKLKSFATQFRWWHFLWLLVVLSGQVFRVRDVEAIQANPLDFWAVYRVVLMSIVALVLLSRLVFRRTSWDESFFRGLIGLVTGYAMVSLVSTLWSVYPMWTLYKSIEYLVDLALIAAVVVSVKTVEEFKTLFDFNWVILSFLIGTVWLGVAVWPEGAIIHQGLLGVQIQGVLPAMETNGVGDLGAVLGVVTLARLLFPTKHRRFYLVVFFISMATLVLSQSRSPLTGFLVALILVLFAARRICVIALFAVLLPAVLSVTHLGDLFWEFFQRGQTSKVFESLSGRVQLWELAWDLFKEQPLIGYGAYAGARFGVIANLRATAGSSILNTWLEVLIGTGLLGLMPFVGAFLGVWMVLLHFAARVRHGTVVHRLQVEAIGVLAVLSVRSVFTSELIWHPPSNFFLVLGYAELLRRAYREQVYEANYGSATISHRVANVQS